MTIQPFQPTAKNSRYAIPAAPNKVRQRAMIRLIMRRIVQLCARPVYSARPLLRSGYGTTARAWDRSC
jgi:hypothetical protein